MARTAIYHEAHGSDTTMTKRKRRLPLAMLLLTLAVAFPPPMSATQPAAAQEETSHLFPETGKTVQGVFLQYWQTHGALAQQGYPISDETTLKSTDGKAYRTQFFQRAVFEQHPEYAGTPNEVLLKLSGQTFYERHFANTPPPAQTANSTNTLAFKETGHSIGGAFRAYWEKHGGLAQQGFPITEELTYKSTDGKEYTTQIFQRAVMEQHPEFAGTENEVLLRLLGVEEMEAMNAPQATPTAAPATPTVEAQKTATPIESGNEGLPQVEIPFQYGKLTVEDQDSQLDFQITDMNTFAQALNKETEVKNIPHGNKIIKVLPFGTTLKDSPDRTYKGLRILPYGIQYDDTHSAAVEMTLFGTDGIAYLQVESADDFNKAKNNNQKWLSQGSDYTDARIGANIIVNYGDDGNPRSTIGNDLGDKIFGYKDSNNQAHFEQTPLKVSVKPQK